MLQRDGSFACIKKSDHFDFFINLIIIFIFYIVTQKTVDPDVASFLHAHGLLRDVIRFAGGPIAVTGLRASCRSARALVPAPPKKYKDANALLRGGEPSREFTAVPPGERVWRH